MQNENFDYEFQEQITEQKLTISLVELLNPQNDVSLKEKGKQFFTKIALALSKVEDIHILQKIAKFIMVSIMLGHIHILHMFDRYLLRQIISLRSSILRLTSLSPIRDKNNQFQPKKWKNQFAHEILYLLAKWFPYDFINVKQESRYKKIIQKKNIKVEGFFILADRFVEKVEEFIDNLDVESEKSCTHCIRFYEKLVNGEINSPPTSNNTKITENQSQNENIYVKSQIQSSLPCLIEPSRLRKLKQNKKQQQQLKELEMRMKQKILRNKNRKIQLKKRSRFENQLSVMDPTKVFSSM